MSNRIRILHVLGGLGLGGAETFVMNLYRAIDRERVQFDFVIYEDGLMDYECEVQKLGGRVFKSPHFSLKNALKYKTWWREFFKEHQEYDIVHGHVRSTAAIYLSEAKKQGRYTIAHSHSISSGKGGKALIKDIMQYPIRFIADYFFGCSEEANKWLFGKKVAKCGRCKIIKNAIIVENFFYDKRKRMQVRDSMGIGLETCVVGNVGRLVPAKNQKFLLDVFCALLKKNKEALLLVVGSGDLEFKLKSYATDLGIEKYVRFLGNRDDVNKILLVMDVFVFPSIYEGLGIVAIEAQCTGLPVICSKAVPLEAKVTDNLYYISLEESPESWASETLKIVDGYERVDCSECVTAAGYDAFETARFLQEFYEMVNKEFCQNVCKEKWKWKRN